MCLLQAYGPMRACSPSDWSSGDESWGIFSVGLRDAGGGDRVPVSAASVPTAGCCVGSAVPRSADCRIGSAGAEFWAALSGAAVDGSVGALVSAVRDLHSHSPATMATRTRLLQTF